RAAGGRRQRVGLFQIGRGDRQNKQLRDSRACIHDKIMTRQILQLDFDFSPIVGVNPTGADFDILRHRQSRQRPDASHVSLRKADGDARRDERMADVHAAVPDDRGPNNRQRVRTTTLRPPPATRCTNFLRPNCITSPCTLNVPPRTATRFDSSTSTTNREAAEATIFSFNSAPPPPLMRLSCGSTWSAPSSAMS